MAIDEGMMFTSESAIQMRELVRKGTFGFGVFQCNDLLATYEELKAKGVQFKKEPTKEFYGLIPYYNENGVAAIFKEEKKAKEALKLFESRLYVVIEVKVTSEIVTKKTIELV
jgi:hypothetical protein